MKAFLAVTDNDWFAFQASRLPDEVNFWRPGGNTNFKAIQPGELFLFKLHAPLNFIVGGGFFVRFSFLPASLAWEAFEQKNGMATYPAFLKAIRGHRFGEARTAPDPKIGCIILTAPFFLSRENWIPTPEDFKSSIVQGKTYDEATETGRSLFAQLEAAVRRSSISLYNPGNYDIRPPLRIADEDAYPRYGADFLTHARLGQGAFRILVTDAYQRRCAMTGEKTLPVLEAAHIKPFGENGPHRISNGLLLRSDLHILFDRGYITVNEQQKIEVSQRIHSDFGNGREYYALHGKPLLVIPNRPDELPSKEYLLWHNENRFIG
jgi:putative restriction endonuclease